MKKLMFVFSAFLCMLFCPMTGATEAKASEASVTSLQQFTVTFQIVDEEGEPMVGVYVGVKNTQLGAASDLDGKVSVNVPKLSSILVISFVEYDVIEIEASELIRYDGRLSIVVMKPSEKSEASAVNF